MNSVNNAGWSRPHRSQRKQRREWPSCKNSFPSRLASIQPHHPLNQFLSHPSHAWILFSLKRDYVGHQVHRELKERWGKQWVCLEYCRFSRWRHQIYKRVVLWYSGPYRDGWWSWDSRWTRLKGKLASVIIKWAATRNSVFGTDTSVLALQGVRSYNQPADKSCKDWKEVLTRQLTAAPFIPNTCWRANYIRFPWCHVWQNCRIFISQNSILAELQLIAKLIFHHSTEQMGDFAKGELPAQFSFLLHAGLSLWVRGCVF